MWIVRGAVPVAVVLAVVSAVTAVLWVVKLESVGPQHLVFFYLLPTALIAVLYGSLPAMMGAIAATLCAAYFLYDPLYSFSVANPQELGELFCFAGLALIGAKCTADLLRPVTVLSQQDPATERPEPSA
jgi:K+-sensing histidine kinase KdpD